MTKGTAFVGFLLSFVAGAMLMWGVDRGTVRGAPEATAEIDNPAEWSDAGASIPVDSKDPTWGSRSAPVTIVLFSDYQCPFCGKVEDTLEELKQKYGPRELRIIWKNNPLPFHPNARPAAIAGETVFRLGGNDAFWKWHKLAFDNQKTLSPDAYADWAAQSGLDKAKFNAAYEKQEFAAKVDADLALGAKTGVRGTPASFINGISLPGAVPTAKFVQLIDEQLAAAKSLSGVAPDKVYVTLSNQNKAKSPAPEEPKPQEQRPQEEDKSIWKVPVTESDNVRGPADALVTIVEFSDFQCPFCARVYPTIEQVMKDYDGKVRFVFKERPLPMHNRAIPAANLALEAKAQKGQKGFWDAYDLMFHKAVEAQQDKETDPTKRKKYGLEDADLEEYAKELGLDVAKVKAAVKDDAHKAEIDADNDAGDDVEAQGTPHFFINGRRLVGAQPIDKFKSVIDEELKKAEELVAKGTPKKDVYAKTIENGKEPPPPERREVPPPPPDAPWKGNGKSKVVLQIFSDFQCPFCKRVEPTLKEVEKEFGSKIKIVWRDKPLEMHKDAPLAAQAGREAYKQKKDDGFWKFHDALFAAQGTTPDAIQRTGLEKIAEQQGLDMAAFKKALDSEAHKAEVDASSKVAEDAKITGTPAFVVNGYFINGAQPYSRFKRAILLALADAEGGAKGKDAKGEKKAPAMKP